MIQHPIKLIVILLLNIICYSCSNDDNLNNTTENTEVTLTENVEVFHSELIHNNLVFGINNGGTNAFLIDKTGDIKKEWNFDVNLGNDLEILSSGNLVGIFKSSNPEFSFGGYGGIIKEFDFNGNELWTYEYQSENYIAHHDVEKLPNGNILFLAWEKLSANEAQGLGINTANDIFPETLIEINPSTNQIVWEWHSKDHIIQDFDSSIPSTYGIISENPNLINFNYNLVGGNGDNITNGDIMHANGIFYDEIKDIVYISVNFYDEVWIIDHSTTTQEAASSLGGNYNKGGNLIYRFGNPKAYNNTTGEQLFFRNHHPNLVKSGLPGEGNLLIYMNGTLSERSIVYEFEIPSDFQLLPNTNNEPNVVWSFQNENLFNARISGVVRLSNGNTLICEGDYGFWEVTPTGQIAWKYNGDGNFWRAYAYDLEDLAISNLNL